MSMKRILIWSVACLALAGCATTTPAPEEPTGIRPDAGGIAIEGTEQRIDFGRAEEGAVAAVTRILGEPQSRSVNSECGAGATTIVKFKEIDLLFLEGDLRGWVTNYRLTVAGNGLSPGIMRNQLAYGAYGPFRETSLGVEFEADGVFGLLPDAAPDTPIQLLWSGTSCFFR